MTFFNLVEWYSCFVSFQHPHNLYPAQSGKLNIWSHTVGPL